MSNCDFDPPSVLSRSMGKSRKPHKCCECHGTIRKGEEYELSKGCWDGRWDAFKTCNDCVHLRCTLDDCVPFGELGMNLDKTLYTAFVLAARERGAAWAIKEQIA